MTKDGKPTNTKIVVVESEQEMKQFLNSQKKPNENIEILSKEMLEDFRHSFQSMLEGEEPHYVLEVLLPNIHNIEPDSMRKLCKIFLDHRQVQDPMHFYELYNFVKFLQTKNPDPHFQEAINTAMNESLGLLLKQDNIRNEVLEVILSDPLELSVENFILLDEHRSKLEKLNDGNTFHWLIYKTILVDNKIDFQHMSTQTRGDDRINILKQYKTRLLDELLDNMRSPNEEPFVRFILSKLDNAQFNKEVNRKIFRSILDPKTINAENFDARYKLVKSLKERHPNFAEDYSELMSGIYSRLLKSNITQEQRSVLLQDKAIQNDLALKQDQKHKAISEEFKKLNNNISSEISKFNFGNDQDRQIFADTILNNFQAKYPNLAEMVTKKHPTKDLKQSLCEKLKNKEEEFEKSHWKITKIILDLLGIKKQDIIKSLSKDIILNISPVVPSIAAKQGKNTQARLR